MTVNLSLDSNLIQSVHTPSPLILLALNPSKIKDRKIPSLHSHQKVIDIFHQYDLQLEMHIKQSQLEHQQAQVERKKEHDKFLAILDKHEQFLDNFNLFATEEKEVLNTDDKVVKASTPAENIVVQRHPSNAFSFINLNDLNDQKINETTSWIKTTLKIIHIICSFLRTVVYNFITITRCASFSNGKLHIK